MSAPRESAERAKNGKRELVAAKAKNLVAAPPLSPNIEDTIQRWRSFKRFINDLDELLGYYDGLIEDHNDQDPSSLRTVADLEADAEWCQKQVAKCKAGFERFDPAHNYEEDGGGKVLKADVISARLGEAINSMHENKLPQSPDQFAIAMVKHVDDVKGLTMPALESACHEIERIKWPDLRDVVEIINKHVRQWRKRVYALDAERFRLTLIPKLIEREQKKKKEMHEREVERATEAVQCAMWTRKQLMKEISAAEEENEAAKAQIEKRNARLAVLMQEQFKAEQLESELIRKLRKLENEEEQAAIVKLDGANAPLGTLH